MCQVSATQYFRCQCRYLKAEKACKAGFSPLESSCRNKKNEIVRVVTANQPSCPSCLLRMEQMIRSEYAKMVESIVKEGFHMRWDRHEIDKAIGNIRKSEHEEVLSLHR